jgi:hypothetical protein
MPRPTVRTCSSRSPARSKASPPSRRRSFLTYRSTSRCCSRAATMSWPPMPTCGGLERRVAAGLSPDVRSSLGVRQRATMEKVPGDLRDRLGISVSQQSYDAYRDLLKAAPEGAKALARSACCSPAPATRTQRPPTCSTWARSLRRTLPTPCPRRRCWPSPTTVRSARRCRAMAVIRNRCW